MEESRITFETAVIAKEKGFPQQIFPCFSDDGEIHSVSYFTHTYPESNSYFQSTQSLLQKWIREKLNVSVIVYNVGDFYDWDANGRKGFDIEFDDYITEEHYFKTYEEALEKGLLETLKLIKKI